MSRSDLIGLPSELALAQTKMAFLFINLRDFKGKHSKVELFDYETHPKKY